MSPQLPPHEPEAKSIARTQTTAISWQGPLPPPGALREFNEVIPNGAERVMVLCEKQSAHRQELEKIVVESRTANMKRGQVFALIIAIFGLCVAAFCAYLDQPLVACIVAGTDLVALVSAFIYGSHAQRKELQERATRE